MASFIREPRFCHVVSVRKREDPGNENECLGKDLFPYLKVHLDVRCLEMKLNHWNRNANS